MTVVVWILAVILGAMAVVALAGYIVSRTVVRSNAARGDLVLGPAGPADHQESAALLFPAEGKGFGMLRATPGQLLFASGRPDQVIRIDRGDISSVGPTQDVPEGGIEKTIKRPALAVTTEGGGAFLFAVTDVASWVARLT